MARHAARCSRCCPTHFQESIMSGRRREVRCAAFGGRHPPDVNERYSICAASFVTEPFCFAPGLSLQSTTDPSARCSCMLQCNSVAPSGFLAVNGSATYLLGCTSICHVITVMRSPIVFVV